MRPRNTAASQAAAEDLRRLENSKKDISHERADIAGLTLLFKDQDTERKWRMSCQSKRSQMTARFLFLSGLYQALFFMSDISDNNNSIFFKGCWRLACGLSCWTLCFLVATTLISPSQILLFYVQLLYGGLSLFLHFLGREQLGSWDFLIVVYGLCFFMLPKISPLNFIHSFMGSSILSLGYIYLSAFWLDMDQWILSTIYLVVISLLFMYISYSSEKSSRERWLLRQRLNREHIDLQMVASSIQGDMAAARLRSGRGGASRQRAASPVAANAGREHVPLSQTERMNNFFKGIAAWAICMSMGYAFQVMGADADPPGVKTNSKAFALLMHSMGFSIFLLYFTGQMRWFAINGIVGMMMLWIFNETGLDNRWAVISTHSIGYFVLALVVVSSILVFGGVVLVWTQLIDFLMNILNRYPEMKEEIRQEKILESVLVRYLAEMPRPTVLHRPSSLAEEEAGADSQLLDPSDRRSSAAHDHFSSHGYGETEEHTGSPGENTVSGGVSHKKLSRVLEAKKPNCCFFCSKNEPVFLLPACAGWAPRDRSDGSALSMCTPYSELAHTRDSLNLKIVELSKKAHSSEFENSQLRMQVDSLGKALEREKSAADETVLQLNKELEEVRHRLLDETQRRERDIDAIISQHNTQLSEIKRLYKKLQARQRTFLAQHQTAMLSAAQKHDTTAASTSNSVSAPKPSSTSSARDAHSTKPREPLVTPPSNIKHSHSSPSETLHGDYINATANETQIDASYLLNDEFSDMQREFDRLLMESFEEVQTLLLSNSTDSPSENTRMKYTVNFTDDSSML